MYYGFSQLHQQSNKRDDRTVKVLEPLPASCRKTNGKMDFVPLLLQMSNKFVVCSLLWS